MDLKRTFLTGAIILASSLAHANSPAPPQPNAGAVDVVKFVVNYENHAADADQLLRGKSDQPTKLESLLFTHDFLTEWYAIKAKEAAGSPDIDNVTDGEQDYIINGAPKSLQFKDMSDKLNGAMVSITYRTNGPYSSLFFLKQEDGRLKIDDISLEPFVYNNFDPNTLHRPGVSSGVRNDMKVAIDKLKAPPK